MAVTFQRERLTDIRAEIEPLLELHWREIAHYQDIPLDPDWMLYEHSEDSGILRTYTARHDGLLAGYGVFFLRHAPHYRNSIQAVQDVLFLVPEMRKTTSGNALIAYADEQLAAEGAQVVYHHQKAQHPALGMVLKRRGYEIVDIIWAKRLDGGA